MRTLLNTQASLWLAILLCCSFPALANTIGTSDAVRLTSGGMTLGGTPTPGGGVTPPGVGSTGATSFTSSSSGGPGINPDTAKAANPADKPPTATDTAVKEAQEVLEDVLATIQNGNNSSDASIQQGIENIENQLAKINENKNIDKTSEKLQKTIEDLLKHKVELAALKTAKEKVTNEPPKDQGDGPRNADATRRGDAASDKSHTPNDLTVTPPWESSVSSNDTPSEPDSRRPKTSPRISVPDKIVAPPAQTTLYNDQARKPPIEEATAAFPGNLVTAFSRLTNVTQAKVNQPNPVLDSNFFEASRTSVPTQDKPPRVGSSGPSKISTPTGISAYQTSPEITFSNETGNIPVVSSDNSLIASRFSSDSSMPPVISQPLAEAKSVAQGNSSSRQDRTPNERSPSQQTRENNAPPGSKATSDATSTASNGQLYSNELPVRFDKTTTFDNSGKSFDSAPKPISNVAVVNPTAKSSDQSTASASSPQYVAMLQNGQDDAQSNTKISLLPPSLIRATSSYGIKEKNKKAELSPTKKELIAVRTRQISLAYKTPNLKKKQAPSLLIQVIQAGVAAKSLVAEKKLTSEKPVQKQAVSYPKSSLTDFREEITGLAKTKKNPL